MSAPASEVLREVERELAIATESGETRSRADLQGRFELGAADLQAALDRLREHGKAVEDAPGEWRGPVAGESPSAELPRVQVSVPDEEPDGEGGVQEAARIAQAARSQHSPTPFPVPTFIGPQPQVRLTRAIADALDEQALGKIVKAALESLADDDETFRFEVTP